MGGSASPDRVAVYREAVGRLLMSRRKRSELTLGQLAKRAEMSRAGLGRIEAGESSPNVELIRRLTDALGTTPAVLFADLERAITYLEARGTLIVEAMPGEASGRGRLAPVPKAEPAAWPRLRVAGVTLMREIEAGLGLRADPPRTPDDAFRTQCEALGLGRPRTAAERRQAANLIAAAILDGGLDEALVPDFGPPDPLAEDTALLEPLDPDDE